MSYYFSKVLKDKSFDEVIEHVTNELKKEGFGVLTQISIDETLKNKISVDFKRYTILGACNPHAAYKALQKENKIGLFLPCNVIVEALENGTIEVSAVDPVASMISVRNEGLESFAKEIQKTLKKVIANL